MRKQNIIRGYPIDPNESGLELRGIVVKAIESNSEVKSRWIRGLSQEPRNFNRAMSFAKGCIVVIQRHTQKGIELVILHNNGTHKAIVKPMKLCPAGFKVSTTEKWWFIGTPRQLESAMVVFVTPPFDSRVKPYTISSTDTEVAIAVSSITNSPIMEIKIV